MGGGEEPPQTAAHAEAQHAAHGEQHQQRHQALVQAHLRFLRKLNLKTGTFPPPSMWLGRRKKHSSKRSPAQKEHTDATLRGIQPNEKDPPSAAFCCPKSDYVTFRGSIRSIFLVRKQSKSRDIPRHAPKKRSPSARRSELQGPETAGRLRSSIHRTTISTPKRHPGGSWCLGAGLKTWLFGSLFRVVPKKPGACYTEP